MVGSFIPRVNRVSRRILRRAQLPLDHWLINLSAVRHPSPVRKSTFRTVATLRQGLMLYLEGMQGAAQAWAGEEIESGQPMRVLYLGEERAVRFHSPEYLQHLLFRPETVQSETLKTFPMLQVRSEAEKLQAEYDLIITDANGYLRWEPHLGKWSYAPNWIRMEFIFEPGMTWDAVERRFRAHKNNVKRVHQNGYTYRISQDEADFELFYDHMYVPLIESRYGEYGAIDDKESMRKEFHDGFLLMIDDAEGQPVAAQLTYVFRKTMYSIYSGILDGSQVLHSKGALSAIYYYSLRWCCENEMERFEMGGCRPFETDGLYQYKLRWGMTPTPDLWGARAWLLWAPRADTPSERAAVDWLEAHPVVSLDPYWSGETNELAAA